MAKQERIAKPSKSIARKRPESRQAVPILPAHWNHFLEQVAICGNVTKAAAASNIDRSEAYRHRMEDEEFAKAWRAAEELGIDGLIDEAKRRAYDGTDKPVYQGGKLVGTIKEYSDTLLMFLVKARRPEYKDKSADVNVTISLESLIVQSMKPMKEIEG